MFDLSWGEIAVIGAVALIVIGPKELPGVLRGLGQSLAKLRRMASDFQYQFNQALQEAEVDKVKDQFNSINNTIDAAKPVFNPIDYAREQIKSAVDDIKTSTTVDPNAIGPQQPVTDPLASIPVPESYSVDPASIINTPVAAEPAPAPVPVAEAAPATEVVEEPVPDEPPAPKRRKKGTAA
ncbi:MAG: Sec-independent protein translocase protein TatB [Alphaproteobacteria bacterium]